MGSRQGKRPAGEQPVRVGGISFWQAVRDAIATELNSRDDLSVDGAGARWVVTPVTGGQAGPPIESTAPEVRHFLQRVVDEKLRVARSGALVRPFFKPARSPAPALPPHAPVPCPLCRPGADAQHPGEAWPDCELCDGEGVVTARRAAEWREDHD
jgi:hypothetical protein